MKKRMVIIYAVIMLALMALTSFVSIIIYKAETTSVTGSVQSESYINSIIYQGSAEVAAQCLQVYELAKLRLQEYIVENGGNGDNLAIVTDIDATLFYDSSYFAGVLLDSDGREKLNLSTWNNNDWYGYYTAIASEAMEPVPGALSFIQYAYEQGVKVFFITNRPYYEMDLTVKQLEKAGFIDENTAKAYFALGDMTQGLQEYHTYEETDEIKAFCERINSETEYEMGPGYFSLKGDYTIQLQGTDFSSDKAKRRSNVVKQIGQNGKIVLYLGDSINDMVSAEEYLYTNYSKEESAQYNGINGNLSRTEAVMNEIWKEKWGTLFLVLPNAVYGDWQKAVWYKQEVTDEQKSEAIKKQLKEHSYKIFERWYNGASPVGEDIQ